jgi:hypothetical protein
MNQYLLIRRLRWPVILVTFGVTALLDQYDILGYGRSWPLYLIVIGILQLAERAALTQTPPVPPAAYYGATGVPPTTTVTSIVPANEERRS